MPIYDYDCAACGRRFEVIHGVHAEGPTACELCGGGPVRKAVTAAAVHYRGSGWAKKERRSAASSKAGAEKATETSASDGATDKSEGGTDKSEGGTDKPTRKTDAPAAATDSSKKRGTEAPAPTPSTRTD